MFFSTVKPTHNISIAALIGIAERSRAKMARFIIDMNGVWHGGDGEHLTHWYLSYSLYDRYEYSGYIYHEPHGFTYMIEDRNNKATSDSPGALRFNNYGLIERPKGDDGYYTKHPTDKELGLDQKYARW